MFREGQQQGKINEERSYRFPQKAFLFGGAALFHRMHRIAQLVSYDKRYHQTSTTVYGGAAVFYVVPTAREMFGVDRTLRGD